LPFNWGSKAESALRLFGADRALLLIEGVAIAAVNRCCKFRTGLAA
jgi:hypothetical protein